MKSRARISRRTIVYTVVMLNLLAGAMIFVAFLLQPAPVEGFYELLGDDALWYYGDGKVYLCLPRDKSATLKATYEEVDGALYQTWLNNPTLKVRLVPGRFSLTMRGLAGRQLTFQRRHGLGSRDWSQYQVKPVPSQSGERTE